jgi:hypothetical protein
MRQWIGIAAALTLAACSSGGGGDDANKAADGNGAAAAEGGGGSAATMQPGQWEITTNVTRIAIPGMPAGMTPPMPPPTTVRNCLTPEQAAQPGAGFVTGSGETEGCTYQSNSVSGGRIQAVVQCTTPAGNMRSTINGQFTATSFEVNQQVQTSAQGQTMDMESRTTGRRVGDCPAGGGTP